MAIDRPLTLSSLGVRCSAYRYEVLDAHLVDSLDQVREVTEQWLHTYNEIRPNDALGRIPPAA